MSANPRDIPTMRMVVGSTSERYNPTGDISYGLIRYNTTDNNVEAYAKDGWVNLQGGSGTDASFDRIGEYTNNSGITFLSDVSVNGVLNSTDGSFSGNLYSASNNRWAGGWILVRTAVLTIHLQGPLTGSEANPTLNLFRGNKYIFINNTGGHRSRFLIPITLRMEVALPITVRVGLPLRLRFRTTRLKPSNTYDGAFGRNERCY